LQEAESGWQCGNLHDIHVYVVSSNWDALFLPSANWHWGKQHYLSFSHPPSPDLRDFDPSSLDLLSNHPLRAYAKHLILTNLSSTQRHHISQQQNAQQVWSSLISLHQPRGFDMMLAYLRTSFHMIAAEDESIPNYINKMKSVVEQVTVISCGTLVSKSTTLPSI
jgi:hypothetical protein